MVKDDRKIDVYVHSYISEFENLFSKEVEEIMKKINECTSKINKIEENKNLLLGHEDPNFKLFSPSSSKKEEINNGHNLDILSIEIELKEYHLQYSRVTDKLNNIRTVGKYINLLENSVFDSKENNKKKPKEKDKVILENQGIKILETQEIERKRIARDLHDSTVQNLTNLVHKTELCSKLVDMDTIRAKLELETMINTIRTTINDMRNIIYDLRPMSLDDLGLVVTLHRYIDQVMIHNDIKIELKVKNDEINILPVINLSLYRIIQESCNNSLKHSKAKNISVYLEYGCDYILVIIKDDGIGFDNKKEEILINIENSKFGLSIMKERVHLLSGTIKIVSSVDRGTQINVRVPLNLYHGGK